MATKQRQPFAEYVSVSQAAGMLGLTPGRIRQIVQKNDGTLPAAKVTGTRAWIIAASDVRDYAKRAAKSDHS